MLFHLSIVAKNPEKVTHVLAELMGGKAQPFPAVEKAWIAFANDALGTAIEVYPLETTLKQGYGNDQVIFAHTKDASYPRSVHFALKTPLEANQIFEIGKKEGWRVLSCSRGGFFHVIELWIENEFLVELITPDRQSQAVDFHNSKTWSESLSL